MSFDLSIEVNEPEREMLQQQQASSSEESGISDADGIFEPNGKIHCSIFLHVWLETC